MMATTTEAATPSSERRVGPRLYAKRVAGSVDPESVASIILS
jgi:hypothetical protein